MKSEEWGVKKDIYKEDSQPIMGRPTWYASHPPACTCVSCQEKQAISRQHGKIGRNEKCPCGSGKKYKRCHGQ